jgi:hypothetical protein
MRYLVIRHPHVIEKRNLQLVSWTLDDGEQLHREAPSTFWMPAAERRHALAHGDIVKLIFRMTVRDRVSGAESVEVERMWVVVGGREGDRYRGALDNDPYCTRDLISGASVDFEPRHVIQIYDNATDPTPAGARPRTAVKVVLRAIAFLSALSTLATIAFIASATRSGIGTDWLISPLGLATLFGWAITLFAGPVAAVQLWRLKESGRRAALLVVG